MKNIIIIGDNDYTRARAHLPDYSVIIHDLTRGLPHDLYAAHIRLSETKEDFEVLFIRRESSSYGKYEEAILALARYFNRKITVVV